MKLIFKVVFVLCLLAAIRGDEPAEKKNESKDKPTEAPITTTTTSTTTEMPKKEEPSTTTPSTTTTSTTTEEPKKEETSSTTAATTAAPTPAVNNQAYPQFSPFGFYPGFYPGFAQPQVPNLGARINLDSDVTEASSKVPQDILKPQAYAGVFPLRQNPFPNNPFLGQFPGRGVSAYSGTFSG